MQFRSDLIKSEACFMLSPGSATITFSQAWVDIFITYVFLLP